MATRKVVDVTQLIDDPQSASNCHNSSRQHFPLSFSTSRRLHSRLIVMCKYCHLLRTKSVSADKKVERIHKRGKAYAHEGAKFKCWYLTMSEAKLARNFRPNKSHFYHIKTEQKCFFFSLNSHWQKSRKAEWQKQNGRDIWWRSYFEIV